MNKALVSIATVIALSGCADQAEKRGAAPPTAEQLTRIITDVRTTPVITGIRTAEGGRPVVVFYKLSNSGAVPIDAEAMPVPVLFNAQGVAFQPDPVLVEVVATADGVQYDIKSTGQLNPGITTYGFTVFEVSDSNWKVGGWTVGWPGQSPQDRLPIPVDAGEGQTVAPS